MRRGPLTGGLNRKLLREGEALGKAKGVSAYWARYADSWRVL